MVRAVGKPTGFSSSWEAAVDADSVAEDSQPGTASRCTSLVSAGLPRCRSPQSLTGFSRGELWSKLGFFDVKQCNDI